MTEEKTQVYATKRSRPSLLWPLLLIAAGVVLVLINLNILEGDAWDLISRLWPLIFIVGALDEIFKGEGFVGSLVMIGFGSLLLLSTMRFIEPTGLDLILRLWPVFLVALGLNLIFRERTWVTYVVGSLIAIAFVLVMFWYVGLGTPTFAGGTTPDPVRQELDGADQARIQLDQGVGSLMVSAGSDDDLLVSGEVRQNRSHRTDSEFELENGTAIYRLFGPGDDDGVFIAPFGNYRWDLGLTPAVPLELQTNLGVGEQKLDLTGLQLEQLNAEVGVGLLEITLPADGEYNGRVSNGVGGITLRVPEDLAVVIHLDTGVTPVILDDEFDRSGDTVVSTNADLSQTELEIVVNQGVGWVRVVSVP